MQKEKILDDLDKKILSILMENAKKAYSEIGQQLFVSGGTIHVRMKKMEELGLVKGYNLVIDHNKLGYDIVAFLGIYLDKSSLFDQVSNELKKIPEVVGAHYTTGQYGIFAKIICRDTNHLKDLLHDKIQKINGIQRTETFISMEESIDRHIQLIEEDE